MAAKNQIKEVPREAFDDLAEIFRQVAEAVAGLNIQCRKDGFCCRFDRSGLNLFATRLESDYLRLVGGGPRDSLDTAQCPCQTSGLCTGRMGRPLGCRIYFCDPAYGDRQQVLYERFHQKIIDLHERHGVAYDYRDLLEHLALSG